MLMGLLSEFDAEIAGKEAKMDSDPHFWMPLTMKCDSYVKVMTSKGETAEKATAHHGRMQAFRTKLLDAHPDKGMFGAINVGSGSYWWDYGLLALYMKNNLLLPRRRRGIQVSSPVSRYSGRSASRRLHPRRCGQG